ncbi:MAG TPA: ureidoglycolate lyase [Acidobacteriaceae bacterium]|jgi:ureidoglycolate hydrolase|nr:ureidoglycolate lyase [Acidobacteriaceae bacterium]
MESNYLNLTARQLTGEAWKPYGWLPVSDTNPADGQHTLRFEWHDAHVNLIHHAADEIAHKGESLICDRLFRHLTHTQALLILDVDAVVVVAPPGASFSTPDDLRQLEAFTLRPHDALVLHQGTWHWGPFPVRAPRVNLYNVQGRRYIEDNECQLLTHLGVVLCSPVTG